MIFKPPTLEEIDSIVDLLVAVVNKRLAHALIAGEVGEDTTVTFKVKDDELVMG